MGKSSKEGRKSSKKLVADDSESSAVTAEPVSTEANVQEEVAKGADKTSKKPAAKEDVQKKSKTKKIKQEESAPPSQLSKKKSKTAKTTATTSSTVKPETETAKPSKKRQQAEDATSSSDSHSEQSDVSPVSKRTKVEESTPVTPSASIQVEPSKEMSQGAFDPALKEWVWNIGVDMKLRIGKLRNRPFVDIRHQWNGKPTKKGAFLSVEMFEAIQKFSNLREALALI